MVNLYRDIENLMSKIENKWQRYDYSTDRFSEIVWDETKDLDLSPLGEISNQLQLMELPGVRIQQQRSTFSDLYMQIFHNGRFMIEILNWWGGHVNVHDHDFAAVQFQLKGDALNVVYDFSSSEQCGALRFGHLTVRNSEIWKEGGRSIVNPGDVDPHSVFHIGTPTTSLLIRTVQTPRYGAQLNYFPDLAAHYYVSNDIQRKKLTALSLLSFSDPSKFENHLEAYLRSQSASENFFMLLKLGPILLEEKYSSILYSYANRGPKEEKILNSVILNCGIDFFKTKANQIKDLSSAERTTAFAIAAAHGEENFKKVLLGIQGHENMDSFRGDLISFLKKMENQDQKIAINYLKAFNLEALVR